MNSINRFFVLSLVLSVALAETKCGSQDVTDCQGFPEGEEVPETQEQMCGVYSRHAEDMYSCMLKAVASCSEETKTTVKRMIQMIKEQVKAHCGDGLDDTECTNDEITVIYKGCKKHLRMPEGDELPMTDVEMCRNHQNQINCVLDAARDACSNQRYLELETNLKKMKEPILSQLTCGAGLADTGCTWLELGDISASCQNQLPMPGDDEMPQNHDEICRISGKYYQDLSNCILDEVRSTCSNQYGTTEQELKKMKEQFLSHSNCGEDVLNEGV